jgi:outer membrane lipoprotein-sorting protein
MFSKRIAMLLLLFCISCLNAQDDVSQKAQALLKKGKENLKRMNYKSIFVDNTGKTKVTYTVYNKSNPDGTNYWRFEANAGEPAPRTLTIRNCNGNFSIYGNTAIKANCQLGRSDVSEQGEHAAYSLSEGSHQGIPCYIVTKKIQPDDGRYNSFIKSFSGSGLKYSPAQLRELFEKSFPTIEVYLVGKNNNFIYEYTHYNIRGNKITNINYGDVELNAALDDKLFEIPGSFCIRVANTPAEYDKINGDIWLKDYEQKHPDKGATKSSIKQN